ncbi:MAG: hypothetical protein AB7O62_02625 [Pirellulales bacterium]
MQPDETLEPAPIVWTTWVSRPAWTRASLTSLLLHMLVLLLLAVTATAVRRGGPQQTVTQLTIVLDSQTDPEDLYSDEQDGESDAEQAPVEIVPGGGEEASESEDFVEDTPPVDVADALPSLDVPQASGPPGTGVGPDPRAMATGRRVSTVPKGGRARTSVYNIEAEGSKFMYVFDHSGSMGGSGHSPLASAKAELKASLSDLGDTHQFQIIFYNEKTTIFPLAGVAGRLVMGNNSNKARAAKFIDGIIADGGTRHEDALLEALQYGPDVIFFLTDADQPELSPNQLARIRRANRSGASINTIEFGLGPRISNDNFLSQLARDNDGQYMYYDTTQLKRLSDARGAGPRNPRP